jgi:pimeloyl-ACP methyl ester carboxylesterase
MHELIRRHQGSALPLFLAALALAGCVPMRPATVPLRTVTFPGAGAPRTLVVLLPGQRDVPEDFGRDHFPEIAARAGAKVDMIAVDAHIAYYYQHTIVDRLREDVIAPARKRYDHVWLAGISIGGTGALLYASQHPEDVDGLILLAPYLGEKAVISEVRAAGGPRGWKPPEPLAADDFQRQLWAWIGRYAAGPERIPLYLGWGRSDSFAGPNGMLGEVLPPERVFTTRGGHGWKAWGALWEQIVRAGALPR